MTPKEKRYHQLYMDIAQRYSEMSHAVRSKVGAIAVKDGNTIGHGWNGMPAGMDNCCEDTSIMNGVSSLVTKKSVQHAEENMLMKMLRAGISSEGATLYLTLEPCLHCSRFVYGAGFKSIYYRDSYRDHSGLDFLKEVGLQVEQLTCLENISSLTP